MLEQQLGAAQQRFAMSREHRYSPIELRRDNRLHGVVDGARRLVAEASAVRALSPWRTSEEWRRRALVGDRPQRLDHAEARRHIAGDVGRLGEVVGGAGRELLVNHPLCGAPAEQHRHLSL